MGLCRAFGARRGSVGACSGGLWSRVLGHAEAKVSRSFAVGCLSCKSGARSCARSRRAKTPEMHATAAPRKPTSGQQRRTPGGCGSGVSGRTHKVWGKHANRRTGITATRFGERVALGGARQSAARSLVETLGGASWFASRRLPAPLARTFQRSRRAGLQRVTPVMIGDRLSGYADTGTITERTPPNRV